jgi:hypothetical protein
VLRPNELLGRAVGVLLAPLTGAVSAVRRARMFHPEGTTYRAQVEPLATEPPLSEVAIRLSGPALVRMSTALWRGGREWIDALGLAVRFRSSEEISPAPDEGDQDLLFATIRSPWTTPVAPLRTYPHDYLANDYYAVSPFYVPALGRKVKWRLVSPNMLFSGANRQDKLDHAMDKGLAVLRLEARRLGWRRPWTPVAELRLLERVEMDQAALRFSPFRTGRGIQPRGFVHALRHATYATSQRARPSSQPGS